MFDAPPLPKTPADPAAPPMFGADAKAKKPQQQSMQPSFLGTEAMANQPGFGGKTLLGQ